MPGNCPFDFMFPGMRCGSGPWGGAWRAGCGGAVERKAGRWTRAADGGAVIEWALPGLSPSFLSVSVQPGGSHIGIASTKPGAEFNHTSLKVPADCDGSQATASCVDGILRINVPTKAAAAPVAVPVLASEPPPSDGFPTEPAFEAAMVGFRTALPFSCPGLAPTDITATVVDGCIVLEGESSSGHGALKKKLKLPQGADANGIAVYVQHGAGTAVVPLAAPAEPTALAVTATPPPEGDEVLLEAQLPGVEPAALEAGLSGAGDELVLQIKYEGRVDEKNEDIKPVADPAQVTVSLVDGILKVSAPAAALARATPVPLRTAVVPPAAEPAAEPAAAEEGGEPAAAEEGGAGGSAPDFEMVEPDPEDNNTS